MNKLVLFFHYLIRKDTYVDVSTLTESTKNDFISFQKQQANRIRSHINYDNDLSGTKPLSPDIIVKFDSATYTKEINQYFVEKDLYNHTTDSIFHEIIMNVLIPEKGIQENVSSNIRKELFIGVLRNIAVHSNLEIKNIIKFYWEFISVLKNPINNQAPESILAIYKECVSGINTDQDHQKAGFNSFQKINIVADYLNSIGLRTNRDLLKLYKKSNYFSFWFGTIVITLIFIASMSTTAKYFFEYILARLDMPGESSFFQFPLLVTLAILIIFRIPSFVRNATKRKIMISTINLFESSFSIKPDVMRVFFKNKYLFDYKRLKRW